jgi:hypothetical protein
VLDCLRGRRAGATLCVHTHRGRRAAARCVFVVARCVCAAGLACLLVCPLWLCVVVGLGRVCV